MSVYSWENVNPSSNNLKLQQQQQQNFNSFDGLKIATIRTTKFNELNFRKKRVRIAFIWRCSILIGVVALFYLYNLLIEAQLGSQVPRQRRYEEADERSQEERVYYKRNLLSALSFAVIPSIGDTGPGISKTSKENCTKPAILDFPWDGFNREERQHGWIILHMLIAIYLFWLLAIVCDEYFVPAIEHLCETLYLSADVIGATFMAIATASPELFMNLIGTFVTHGDIGLGTTVGSAVFNVLAVPAACGILVSKCIKLDWGPLVRDCLLYGIAVLALLVTMHDGRITWYESLFLVISYVLYIIFMMNSDRIINYFKNHLRNWKGPKAFRHVNEFTPLLTSAKSSRLAASSLDIVSDEESANEEATGYASTPWQRDSNTNWCLHILRWPITFWLWLTIPDSRRHPRLTYLTLVMCVVWIGVVSYMVAYAMTIIGDTLSIPDSVMGLTVLAAGMSVPEAVSSLLVTRQGRGTMGISNALGSNTFDILLCLGLPWFVKAFFFPDDVNEPWITLNNSGGLIYATVFLMTSLLGLFVAIVINRFILDWRVGIACLLMYVAFLLIAIPLEMKDYESIVMCEVAY